MTHPADTEVSVPWWQGELLVIQTKHARYLRNRLPALRAYHDDLIGDTTVALTRQIQTKAPEFPASWFESKPPTNEAERSHLHKLAMVILKRRVADLFRKQSKQIASYTSIDDVATQKLAQSTAEYSYRKILLLQLIEITFSVLDEMPVEDRDLVALISRDRNFRKALNDRETGHSYFRKTLNDRERQRLRRIRKKLRQEISRRLGADVADFLRIPP